MSRDIFPGKPVRVASTVPSFVVVEGHTGSGLVDSTVHPAENLVADSGVFADLFDFGGFKRICFEEDFSIDANFAYIVKQSGKPDTLLIPAVETDGNRQLQCQIGGSSQMFAKLDIFKRDCLVDRPEGGFFKVWPAIGRRSPCRDFQRMEKLRGLMVHHFLGFRLALLVFAEVGELFGNGISALLAALLLVETTVRVSQCLVKRDGLAAVHNPVSVA